MLVKPTIASISSMRFSDLRLSIWQSPPKNVNWLLQIDRYITHHSAAYILPFLTCSYLAFARLQIEVIAPIIRRINVVFREPKGPSKQQISPVGIVNVISFMTFF